MGTIYLLLFRMGVGSGGGPPDVFASYHGTLNVVPVLGGTLDIQPVLSGSLSVLPALSGTITRE